MQVMEEDDEEEALMKKFAKTKISTGETSNQQVEEDEDDA